MLSKHAVVVAATIAASCIVGVRDSCGQSTSPRCGESFSQALDLPASISWSQVPLRDGLQRLSDAHEVSVWLDRRVDPESVVEFSAPPAAFRDCLVALAAHQHLDCAWIDCLVYVGPTGAADRFATVHGVHQQLLAKLPAAARRSWSSSRATSWPRLATPRELIDSLAAEAGVQLINPERVPHDLWAAGRWPALPAYTRLGVLLAGFDLTFIWSKQGAAKIIDMPPRPQLRRTYRVPAEQTDGIQQLIGTFPAAKSKWMPGSVQVAATWRVHEALRRKLDVTSRAAIPRDRENVRYTLRAKNQPLGPLLEKLAATFSLACEFSDGARQQYDRLITFEAVEANRDELFQRICAAAGWRYELNDKALRVFLPDE